MSYSQFPRKPHLPHPTAYSSLIAYLEPHEKNKLEQQLDELEGSADFFYELAAKIKEGRWDPLFKECDSRLLPLQALRCVKELSLSSMAFSTCQLMFNVITHHKKINKSYRIIPVFVEGQKTPSERAKIMIDATMKVYFTALIRHQTSLKMQNEKKVIHIPSPSDERIWNVAQESKFYDLLSKMEPCEQRFLLVPTEFVWEKPKREHIMDKVVYGIGFNPFNTLFVEKKLTAMIPTSGMMEAFQQACYPESSTIPVYRLNLSTIEGLHETLKAGGRDLVQSFAPLMHTFPETIDNADPELGRGGERLHDNYHQIRIAQIPLLHRELFLHFADIYFDIGKTKPIFRVLVDHLIEYGVELEHKFYYPNFWKSEFRSCFKSVSRGPWPESNDPAHVFWRTMNEQLRIAILIWFNAKETQLSENSEEFEAALFNFLEVLALKMIHSPIVGDPKYLSITKPLFEKETAEDFENANNNSEMRMFTVLRRSFQIVAGILPI